MHLLEFGENNKFNHPSNEIIERLEKMNTLIYRTDTHGNISIRIDQKRKNKTLLNICIKKKYMTILLKKEECVYMKKVLFYIIGIVIFSFGIGLLLFKIAIYDEKEESYSQKENLLLNENLMIIRTSIEEEKILPNASLILKKNYKGCNHTEKEIVEIPKEIVNLKREEIEESYEDWKIVNFSSKELVMSKDFEGSCNSHYKIKEKEGKIVVYKISNKEENVFKKTDISTEYLTEQDKKELKNGIEAFGIEKVNSILEDFE